MDGKIDGDLEVDDNSVDNIQDEERSDISAAQESWLVPCQLSLTKGEVQGELDLETLISMEEQKYKELAVVKGYCGLDKCPIYVVGYMSHISIALKGSEYVINALGFHVELGTIANDGDVHELCPRFSNQLSYKFCPGIDC